MSTIELSCPGCNLPLRLPSEALGKKGRCRSCGHVFIIDSSIARVRDPVEDTVAGWLGDEDAALLAGEQAPATSASEAHNATTSVATKASTTTGIDSAAGPAPVAVKPTVKPAFKPAAKSAQHPHTFPILLDHVDAMGAFFRFPPQLLQDEAFRLLFPRQCIICGRKEGLQVHLIAWSSKLQNKGYASLDVMHRAVLKLDKLPNSEGRELLKHLPRVESLDEPYCLPMPYYVCGNCSSVGAIMTIVHPAAKGTGDECVLGISSIAQAEAFAVAAHGSDWPELAELRSHIKGHLDPWANLPLTVRIRLGQWYKPLPHETFMLYVPDLEFSKAEAGLAGLVATDRRLIHRKGGKTTEIPCGDQITLQFKKTEQHHMDVQINASGRHIHMLAQESCISQLRQILAKYRHGHPA